MKAIYLKELALFFKTPLGYIYCGITLFMLGLLFTLTNLFAFSANFVNFLMSAQVTFTLTIPLLTMRIFTEERRNKTDQLLLTSPIKNRDIVFAKALACYTLFAINIVIIFIYLIVIKFGGYPDWPRTWGAIIGYLFLGVALINVGLLFSLIMENQMTAAISTFTIIFVLWILPSLVLLLPASAKLSFITLNGLSLLFCYLVYQKGHQKAITAIVYGVILLGSLIFLKWYPAILEQFIPKIILFINISERFANFNRGIITLADVVYFFSFSYFFLYLAVWKLEQRYWSN